MNCFDPKIGQIVGQRSSAQMHEGGEPREPGRLWMTVDFLGPLGCDAPPPALEFMGKHAVEQSGWRIDLANEFELGQFILNAGQARLPRIAAQPQQKKFPWPPRTRMSGARIS